jgi:hypothetical protein
MDPVTIAAIISGASMLGSAIINKSGKGQEMGMTGTDPYMDEQRKRLMAMIMSRIGQDRPYAPVNPMNMMGANMASQYYTGQPYTHPGYGMGSSFAGLTGNDIANAPGGMGSGGPPMGGFPQVPGAPGGMPGQGMGPQYGQMPPGLSKGANFAR